MLQSGAEASYTTGLNHQVASVTHAKLSHLKFQKGFSTQNAWVGPKLWDFYRVIGHAFSDEAAKVIFQRPC